MSFHRHSLLRLYMLLSVLRAVFGFPLCALRFTALVYWRFQIFRFLQSAHDSIQFLWRQFVIRDTKLIAVNPHLLFRTAVLKIRCCLYILFQLFG